MRTIGDRAPPVIDRVPSGGHAEGVVLYAGAAGRRPAEAALFRTLVETASDITSVIAPDGRVLYLGPAATRVFGYPPERLADASRWDFVHPDDVTATNAAVARAFASPGQVMEMSFRALHADGSWRDIEQTVVNRCDDPAVGGLVVTARDVTQRRAAERTIARLNRRYHVRVELGAAMARAHTVAELLEAACRIAVEAGGFTAAWVIGAGGAGQGPDGTGRGSWAAGQMGTIVPAERLREAADHTLGAGQATVQDLGGPWAPAVAGERPAGARRLVAVPLGPEASPVAVLLAATGSGVEEVADGLAVCEEVAREVAAGLSTVESERLRAAAEAASRRRGRQQAIISALGIMAVEMAELDELVEACAVAVVSTLDARDCAVVEAEPGDDTLTVRAMRSSSGAVPVGRTLTSRSMPSAWHALLYREPVLVEDYDADPRFELWDAEDRQGVRSALSVPIVATPDHVGALAVRHDRVRAFTQDDVAFVEAVAHIISGALARTRYQETIQQHAMHDPLTGLPNRALFVDRLSNAIERCRRRSASVGVIVVDLDRFKLLNDTLGHAVGDSLLIEVARRLTAGVRPGDTVARLAGDEFTVLCEDVTEPGDARTIAGRLLDRLTRPLLLEGREVTVAASLGVAFGTRDSTAETVLRDAGMAMHRAKERGGTRIELFDQRLHTRVVHRMQVEEGLRRALERDELVLHYQPVIDLVSGQVVEAEALIRWNHPDHGLVGPDTFIPVAEGAGLIGALGRWVLERACADAACWNLVLRSRSSIGVSVNVSGWQLGDAELVDDVRVALEAAELSPEQLRLEITESVLVEDSAAPHPTLEALHRLGVHLTVDDFGTGYSSLLYLRRYPVRVLKVDRLFVAGLGRNSEDTAIVDAVVALAHSLGLAVTAEGIETLDQLERLRDLGCDFGQGFLWSAGVPYEEFVDLVRRHGGTPAEPRRPVRRRR